MIKKIIPFFLIILFLVLQSYAQDISKKPFPIEQVQQILAEPDYTIIKRLTINIKRRLRKNSNFIKFYEQNDYFIFKTAFINAIAESANDNLYHYLLPYLDDENEHIVASAINAIAYINNPDYLENLIPLLKKYKGNELMTVRILAAMGNLFSDKAIEYISPLIDDHRINISYAALIALSRIGSEKAVSHLIEQYNQPQLQQKIIYCLGKCRTSVKAIDFINQIARTPDSPYFLDAIKAMGELESAENLNYLNTLLDKNDKKKSLPVLYAISRIGCMESIKNLYDFLDTIKARSLKESVYSSIATICSIYSKEEILHTISGTDHPALIAIELGKLGDPSSKEVLLELLEDDDPINKIFAIEAISNIEDQSILEDLIARLSQSGPMGTFCILNYLKKSYKNNSVTQEFLIEAISSSSYRNEKLNIFYALIDYYEMEERILALLSNHSDPYLWVMIDALKNWGDYPSIVHLLKYYMRVGSLSVRYHSTKTLINFAKDNEDIRSFLKKQTAVEKNPRIKEMLLKIE